MVFDVCASDTHYRVSVSQCYERECEEALDTFCRRHLNVECYPDSGLSPVQLDLTRPRPKLPSSGHRDRSLVGTILSHTDRDGGYPDSNNEFSQRIQNRPRPLSVRSLIFQTKGAGLAGAIDWTDILIQRKT